MSATLSGYAHRIGWLIVIVCGLAACGSDNASQSNFRSAVQRYVDQNPQRFDLALPLENTRTDANGLLLVNDRPTLDYAVLQVMTNNGLLERHNGPNMTIHYQISDKADKVLHQGNGEPLSLSLGRLAPAEVTEFTQPVNDNGVKVSHATVVFKNDYADWLGEDDAKKLRDWTAVISQQTGGSNPATRAFSTSLVTTALSAMMTSAFGGSTSDLDQATTYWTALAAKSFTYDITLELKNEGWTPRPQSDGWELQDVEGTGNLKPRAIVAMMPATVKAINHGIEKAEPPGQDAIDKAIVDSGSVQSITLPTPLGGDGKRVCTAEYRERRFGGATLHYDCDEDTIEKLDELITKNLIERRIPKAGEVRYRIKPKLEDYIAGSGSLRVGEYRVDSIKGGKVEIAPSGYSIYNTTVSVTPQSYDWAEAFASDHSSKKLEVQMAHAGDGWFAVNVSAPH